MHITTGFTVAQRQRVRELIHSLRAVRMLPTAPVVRFTKEGKLRISKQAATFRQPNRFRKDYGLASC